MLKIAICDDNEDFVEYSSSIIKKIETDDIKEIDCFTDAKQFLNIISSVYFNMIFLDIDMPEVDGFSIAKKLNEVTEKTILIFVTSHDCAAIKGYEYNAFRFIRKKEFNEQITVVMNDSIKKIEEWKKIITLKYKSNFYKLNLCNIYYIVSYSNYLTIRYEDKDLKFRTPLNEIINKFLKSSFAVASRGIVVNCEHIINLDIQKKIVYLDNSKFIKVSKTGLENIKTKLLELE